MEQREIKVTSQRLLIRLSLVHSASARACVCVSVSVCLLVCVLFAHSSFKRVSVSLPSKQFISGVSTVPLSACRWHCVWCFNMTGSLYLCESMIRHQ